MKIIKINVQNEISIYEYPKTKVKEELQKLIGNGCDIYEHVMPKRLYKNLGCRAEVTNIPGEAVALLVDGEGGLKKNSVNTVASYLYETDEHGNPIMGDILIVGKKWTDSGVSFCGIADTEFERLYKGLEELTEKAKKAVYAE